MIFAENSIPWLLGGFGCIVLIAIGLMIRSWRDSKRSPYFFMRRQAQRRVQQYANVSLVLLLFITAVGLYAWSPAPDQTLRFALLPNAKPVLPEAVPQIELPLTNEPVRSIRIDPVNNAGNLSIDTTTAESALPTTTTPSTVPVTEPGSLAMDSTVVLNTIDQVTAELPAQYRDSFSSDIPLTENSKLGRISFSQEINEQYEPISPRRIFEAGSYTIYAIFSYEGMTDGMEWAWVWQHNSEVVDGGSQIWKYGNDGPGYVYYSPEEGFQAGQYTLQIWVNEELMTQATLTISSAAISQ